MLERVKVWESWLSRMPHIRGYVVIDYHENYECKFNALVFSNIESSRGDLDCQLGCNSTGWLADLLRDMFGFGKEEGRGVPVQLHDGSQFMVKNKEDMIGVIQSETQIKRGWDSRKQVKKGSDNGN